MPYIAQDRRDDLDLYPGKNAGELNFCITELIYGYYQQNGARYQQINDILGALEGAKLEFYRRIAAPYEDGKMLQNGDVY